LYKFFFYTLASQKFQNNGTVLLLENDGTIVDEDEVLLYYEKEIFMFLSENEKWTPTSIFESRNNTLDTYIVNENGDLLKETTSTDIATSSQSSYEICQQIDEQTSLQSNYEYMWKNFSIPFHKFPNDVILEAENRIPLEILKINGEAAQTWLERRWRIQTKIVHIVVDEMRHIKTKIPMSAFKIIATKLSERYPIVRDIDSDNVVIGDGCFTLTMKLIERNNYLNRPFKRKSTTSGKIPGKRSKKLANITSGCSNWDPEPNEEIFDEENLKNSFNTINETNENFHQHLEDSYSMIRTAINNDEAIKHVLNQWPILRESKNAFYWHFQKLTKVDLIMLGIKINSKANKIIEFGIKNKLHHSDDNIEPGLAVIQIFSKYFKEDIRKFIYEIKVCLNL